MIELAKNDEILTKVELIVVNSNDDEEREKLKIKFNKHEIQTQSNFISSSSSSLFNSILLLINTPNIDANLLTNLIETSLKHLKTKSHLYICGGDGVNKQTQIVNELKLNGFVNVSETNGVVQGEKPHFEVGSSSKLKFTNSKQQQQQQQQVKAVWKLDDGDDQEDNNDLINTDDLLDEMDLKKPILIEKFDCGESATGKKKACKNCSCGLAEQLEDEIVANKVSANATKEPNKSSCGSCYLGDAFRCASCPYSGMPAFKPGEKVKLNDNLLMADI